MTTLASATAAAVLDSTAESKSSLTPKQQAKTRELADEFEAFFLYQVLSIMSPEPDEDSILGGSFAESVYRDQMNQELSKSMADRRTLGISDAIYDQLIKAQENMI